jgi:hypothetical protein
MDPQSEYQARLGRWKEREELYDRRHRRVGDLRVLFAVALVVLACWVGRAFPTMTGVVLAGIVIGLFLSGMVHDRVLALRMTARAAGRFYQAGLDRLNDCWAGKGSPGTEFIDPHHPYAVDLDLFGAASVFELLNMAQTQGGRATLAGWLLRRADGNEIRARQKAVKELRDKLELREDLALLAGDTVVHIDTTVLISWANGPLHLAPAAVRIAAFCLPLLTWGLLIAGELPLFPVALAAQMIFARVYKERVGAVFESLRTPARDLNRLAGLFGRLEREKFQTERLQALQAGWSQDGVAASECLRRLARLLDWLDSREHFMVAVLGPLFLLGTQFAFAIEARRARFGMKIEEWLRGLAEMEALSSLAGYAFERPEDSFPELFPESASPRVEAMGLGHPLIPELRSVRNDIDMDSEHRLFVISGSNMSGKSTWLRALGVNMVLAMAGGPVRARQMRLTPLPIGASIRTLDSLNEGISRFYAEVKRLRQIVELTDQNGRLLFLLDELLNGTNSHDRRIGAASVVKSLLDRGAMGLITTHDLALTQIVEEVKPYGANFHFEDQFSDGRMSFDYRLRSGIVEKSNALELMRSIGLDVDVSNAKC